MIDQKGFLIRTYQPADWQSICQIHDLARPDELLGSCDPKAFIPIEQDQEVEHLTLCKKMVAITPDRIAGFIGVDQGFIGWLYVHPDYYGQRMGRELLQQGLKLTTEKAWTIALAGNSRALSLYQSEGFVEVNRYKS
ncbi:MAG: GNAT family N-acetyltransferase, partial [Anaerolineales bacterium]|nr:GNAT family N-acetyltransferase [Anaerolineales bacterium]